ncbi:MAG: nucleotidyltransferase [Saprospiraceae bacterium]|nr:nucleotidyltransferase [Saprospiraceae bacterium]
MREIAIAKLEVTLAKLKPKAGDKAASIFLINAEQEASKLQELGISPGVLKSEAFQIIPTDQAVYVVGGDDRGLMYGILDLRDQLEWSQSLSQVEAKQEAPRFHFRAIKFNLPWSSYRQSESLQLHMETVKDTTFWVDFLDMMADNRFNALTLWNLHPFTFMIQPKAFPEATQFTGQEFEDWRTFWKTLFRMAKDRGIETYILNWNIIVSPQMTEAHNVANYKDDLEWHYGFTPADTSQIIVDYMRECITQVINEYPNLTGVGVSIGERMKMPIEDAMQWVKNTFVEGIRRADRKAKFIHRAPFSIDPEVARQYIESYTDFEDPIIMEFKFNWSHAHSTPHLSITHGGRIKDQYWNPKPTNYQMAWMMRNEDFLMLNWGNTAFMREHIAVNGHDFVAGYFIGSETYIPAKEFRIKSGVTYKWKYAFEKQWAFYQMWGRLLYNPTSSDRFFIQQFELKYGKEVGEKMFEALQLGSRMPLALASFYQGTWDFTLYCEGFLNGGQLYRNYKESTKAFINVNEMITHRTLDPRYLTIDEFTNRKLKELSIKDEEITPLELAEEMEAKGNAILEICETIEAKASKNVDNFQIEWNDFQAWAYLSKYFAAKLRGGVYLDEARKTENTDAQALAVQHLEQAVNHWESLIAVTSRQYQEVSLLHIKTTKFSWQLFLPQVRKDVEMAKGEID